MILRLYESVKKIRYSSVELSVASNQSQTTLDVLVHFLYSKITEPCRELVRTNDTNNEIDLALLRVDNSHFFPRTIM